MFLFVQMVLCTYRSYKALCFFSQEPRKCYSCSKVEGGYEHIFIVQLQIIESLGSVGFFKARDRKKKDMFITPLHAIR